MGIFSKKTEQRTDSSTLEQDGVLLQSIISGTDMTKTKALQIPSISGCVNFAADTVSMIPIKLFKEETIEGTDEKKITELKDDPRVRLLNDDPRDTLDAVQFWRALVTDYYLGKGGYAYIKKTGNKFDGLYYVDEMYISAQKNVNPIFKSFDIHVNGESYKPFDFLKLLRHNYGKSIDFKCCIQFIGV